MVFYIEENVQTYTSPSYFSDAVIKSLEKYNVVIVGERHGNGMKSVYNKLLSKLHFDYFIAEFADMDRSFSREELKKKMDNATDGSMIIDNSKPVDYQYNYWLYDLAYKHNIPLIGCNYVSNIRSKNMNEEDTKRESYMIKTIREFAGKGRCLIQIGDHHLRSIKITKEFLEYCGDTKDDRGIYKTIDDLTVDFISPIWKAYYNSGDAIILRLKKEYDNELAFQNKK